MVWYISFARRKKSQQLKTPLLSLSVVLANPELPIQRYMRVQREGKWSRADTDFLHLPCCDPLLKVSISYFWIIDNIVSRHNSDTNP